MGRHTTSSSPSRFESWRGSWRVSLRMARRDVRRHRGRSLLIVVMVGLPVLLLTAATTLWFTDDLDAGERLPFQLGQSQGFVLEPQPTQLRQLLDPMTQTSWDGEPPASKPVPGLIAGDEKASLARLLGARLTEVTSAPASIRVGDHYQSGSVLGAELSDPASLAPRVTLESGRWPTGPGEVMVTVQGLEHGLPASGTLGIQLTDSMQEAPETAATVVGIGRGYDTQGSQYFQPVDLVTAPLRSASGREWLVDRSDPIRWGEIERLNTYGIGGFSRYVAEHPDTVTRHQEDQGGPNTTLLVVSAAALGLVLLTTLLAGPAFAVSAARQRRTLALAASNGATARQLRRTVLAQALVLGVLSAAVGALLGIVGGVATVVVTRLVRPDLLFGPIEVPWAAIGLVAMAATISSVVAAVIPSRGLGRLDVISVLRGQGVSARLRRRVPLAGVLVALVGATAVTWAAYNRPDYEFVLFLGGSVAIVVGSLLTVPLVLSLVARTAHRLPLPVRMAAREAGRQRGRATPTVAAIMAGASALTVVCIGLQADTVRQARDHVPVVLEGEAVIQGATSPQRLPELARTVENTAPGVHALVANDLVDYTQQQGAVMLAAMRPGCTLADVAPQPVGGDLPTDPDTRCSTASSFGRNFSGASLQAVDLRQLTRFVGLTDEQSAAMRRGAIAVVDPADVADVPLPDPHGQLPRDVESIRPVPLDEKGGVATFALWRQRPGESDRAAPPRASDVQTLRLPVVHVPRDRWNRLVLTFNGSPAGLITTDSATRLGLPVTPTSLIARTDGRIPPDLEAQLNDAVVASQRNASFTVERGYQRDDTLALIVVFGVIGLIILVATLIATALSQTENAPLLGTLAAVGATRRTRRALAGSQALYLGMLGAVIGLLVGLAPGYGLARVVLSRVTEDGVRIQPESIPVPWLQILLPVLLIPLVAGALAWVSIRRAPMVTRRAT
ncbi:FtsX-like permease family protein [Terrabacter sp. NPDC080008]|uniref:FtsX-like permease family protein n=1 Tax=Terrabacter sp. NPDC080008 TaxID=3155176 RepID=UPI00344F588B